MRCTQCARSSHGFAIARADLSSVCAGLSGPTQQGLGECVSELLAGELVGGNTEINVPVVSLFDVPTIGIAEDMTLTRKPTPRHSSGISGAGQNTG